MRWLWNRVKPKQHLADVPKSDSLSEEIAAQAAVLTYNSQQLNKLAQEFREQIRRENQRKQEQSNE